MPNSWPEGVLSTGLPGTFSVNVSRDNRAEGGDGRALVIMRHSTQGSEATRLHVYGSRFLDNVSTSWRGAVFATAWLRDVHDSAVRRNSAGDRGGGIDTASELEGGGENIFMLEYSSVWNNTAAFGGGLSLGNGGNVILRTVSGNTAAPLGGGTCTYQRTGSLRLVLIRATLGDNEAGSDSAHAIFGWGLLDFFNMLIAYSGSVLPGDPCGSSLAAGGTVSADEGSLAEGPCTFMTIAAGAAGLQPLRRNGGPTRSHAVSLAGATKDAGHPDHCRPDTGEGIPSETDRRLAPFAALPAMWSRMNISWS